MTRTSIHEITQTLAKYLVADESMFDEMAALGINPADWPEGRAREIAINYGQLRAKNGHSFAAHMLAKDAAMVSIHPDVPLDSGALRAIYHQELKTFRARRLADRLSIARVGEIDSIVDEYLSQKSEGIRLYNFGEEIPNLIRENEAARAEGRSRVEIPGWERLSEMIGGFNPGRVSLLLAETGFGKTNLSLSIARSAAEVGPVLCINMEMMGHDLGDKLLMGSTKTNYENYKNGAYRSDAIDQAHKKFLKNKLIYTDGRSMSIQEIFGLARRQKVAGGLFALFVDYDQKIKLPISRDLPEWKALQVAVQDLEDLAKQLGIYIMLMSQSNEDGDPSGSKRSKNPATTVLRFYVADGKPVVQAIKNRFGPKDAAIEVEYVAAQSYVAEKGPAVIGVLKKEGRLS